MDVGLGNSVPFHINLHFNLQFEVFKMGLQSSSFEPQFAFQFANQNADTRIEIPNGTAEHSPDHEGGAGPSANSDHRHQQQMPDGIRGHADICTILDQIMNITDQSLDEAQVSHPSESNSLPPPTMVARWL